MGVNKLRIILTLAVFAVFSMTGGVVRAQNAAVSDSVIVDVTKPLLLDSALIGINPLYYVTSGTGNIIVNRSAGIDNAMVQYIGDNGERELHGYRIRIFFDNKQSARIQSENVETEFTEAFPSIPVYRTYSNPYFKVAVGDYRTKSDALHGLEAVKKLFPNAFIIREIINYPQL